MNNYQLESYWNDIPTDRKNAITYDVLEMWWGMSDRNVRAVLHELSRYDNGDNYILIRSGKSKGFYKTDNMEEITKYKKECLNKGRSVFAPIKKINRILKNNSNQYSLENNLRVVRESKNFTQVNVCEYMQKYDASFDVPMLSKMENGVCLPTPYQLERLSDLYGCNPSDLIETIFY